jgi:hypothetical protein
MQPPIPSNEYRSYLEELMLLLATNVCSNGIIYIRSVRNPQGMGIWDSVSNRLYLKALRIQSVLEKRALVLS